MQIEIPIAAVIGALCGALLRWLFVPSPPPPVEEAPAVLEATARPLTAACPDRGAALRAEIAALRLERDALQASARIREARRVDREGIAVPWPKDAGDLAPAEFEEALRSALAASGEAELVSIDCEEYPCIAAVASKTTKPDGNAAMVPFPALAEALAERGYDEDRQIGLRSANIPRGEEGYQAYTVFTFGAGDEPKNTKIRTQFRVNKLSDAAKADLEAK